jgi:predicted N-formylglutamate amidohydrolase
VGAASRAGRPGTSHSPSWRRAVSVCHRLRSRRAKSAATPRHAGLSEADLSRHIASDIGAHAVANLLGEALGAVVIGQTYSRLAIDCNRPLGTPTSIVEVSERTTIPGNVGIAEAEKDARVREIFEPYHRRIGAELDRRRDACEPTVIVAMHSFTPIYTSIERPWHVGVLYRHVGFARHLMDCT